MSRRRSSSFFEDVVAVAAKLPWYVGVVLAAVFFVALGIVAGMENPIVVRPAEAGAYAARQLIKTGATYGQWLIPVLLLIGSAMSAFGQWRRAKRYGKVASADSQSALSRMSWRHFELLVGDYFKQRGFEIDERGGGLPDGGIDLIARRGTDEYVIQCKQWKAIRVGVVPVRELYGVVAARRAAGGFFVTSGSFTAEAIQFAKGLSIELIDGEKLASSIAQHRQAKTVTEAATVNFRSIASGVPSCPRCEAKMVMRTARTGPHPGDQFWGCTRFPACGGTRPA